MMDWILFRKRYLLNNTKDHFIICLSSYIFAKTKQLFIETNLLAFLLLLTISCKQNNKEIASSNELTNTAYTPEVFGDSIDVSGALSVNDIMASLKPMTQLCVQLMAMLPEFAGERMLDDA